MRRDLDLAVTVLAAIGCAVWTAVPWLRVAAGLPLVLVLPGYALSTLIVPDGRGARGKISPVLWRAMWTAGLSLAVAALGGLLLNLTPVGLTRVTWTLSLAGLTVLAAAASGLRRHRSLAHLPHLSRRTPVSRLVACYAVAAVAIAGGAIGLAAASAGWEFSDGGSHPPGARGFAQLWLVPAPGTATLGVRSGYAGTRTFHVVLRNGSRAIGTWDLSLGAGQTWRQTLSEPAGQRLTAELTTDHIVLRAGG
jgi:hypothetical protein